MAAPSEGFTWKLFGNPDKRCRICQRVLRVSDVRENRAITIYPKLTTAFTCNECWDEAHPPQNARSR